MGKWIALGVACLLTLFAWSGYNSLVSADERVKGAWSEVQNQLERRSDLIPNLVNTVQAYATHERGVFKEVAEARAKIGQAITIDASRLANEPALQKQLLEAQQNLSASLGRLIAVAENYPQLKANENFLRLQDELAGTENRIAVARGRAIKTTRDYNQSIRIFPTLLVARFGGFAAKQYYETSEEKRDVPDADFTHEG